MIASELIMLIAQKCQRDPENITVDTRLDELGIDSMQAIVLFHELEERFDLDIPNDVFESIGTVGDVVQQIKQLMKVDGGTCRDV